MTDKRSGQRIEKRDLGYHCAFVRLAPAIYLRMHTIHSGLQGKSAINLQKCLPRHGATLPQDRSASDPSQGWDAPDWLHHLHQVRREQGQIPRISFLSSPE
jgi:hypothetical protein